VTGSDGNDQCLIKAVDLLFAPAVLGVEVAVHVIQHIVEIKTEQTLQLANRRYANEPTTDGYVWKDFEEIQQAVGG
jgi:hypothetical protein